MCFFLFETHPTNIIPPFINSLPSRRRKSPPTRAAEAAAPEWYAEVAVLQGTAGHQAAGGAARSPLHSHPPLLGEGETAQVRAAGREGGEGGLKGEKGEGEGSHLLLLLVLRLRACRRTQRMGRAGGGAAAGAFGKQKRDRKSVV